MAMITGLPIIHIFNEIKTLMLYHGIIYVEAVISMDIIYDAKRW